MNDITDLDRFMAILEIGSRTPPGPDGKLTPEAMKAINLIAGFEQPEGQFSLEDADESVCSDSCLEECFSSEVPGPGWIYVGFGKWVRVSELGLGEENQSPSGNNGMSSEDGGNS